MARRNPRQWTTRARRRRRRSCPCRKYSTCGAPTPRRGACGRNERDRRRVGTGRGKGRARRGGNDQLPGGIVVPAPLRKVNKDLPFVFPTNDDDYGRPASKADEAAAARDELAARRANACVGTTTATATKTRLRMRREERWRRREEVRFVRSVRRVCNRARSSSARRARIFCSKRRNRKRKGSINGLNRCTRNRSRLVRRVRRSHARGIDTRPSRNRLTKKEQSARGIGYVCNVTRLIV